jgi:hypothetical protein
MEKYLTPIQYQQYLHDKAYQAAMAQTTPSVLQVFAVFAICAIALLAYIIIKARRDAQQRSEETLRAEVARHAMTPVPASTLRRVKDENDSAWAKAGGSMK